MPVQLVLQVTFTVIFGFGYCSIVWILWYIYGDNHCDAPLGAWLFYTGLVGLVLQIATVVVNVHQARSPRPRRGQ